jgi:hypothetical protein
VNEIPPGFIPIFIAWGWRIEITPDDRTLCFVMFNIWPDGSGEDLAAEASYSRA